MINNQGILRIARWYSKYSRSEQKSHEHGVYKLLVSNEETSGGNIINYKGKILLFRRYANIFFCMCINKDDNALLHLEAIHFFVEALDHYFHNVCELDLVFKFHKVYAVMDEVFLAGEIAEFNKANILKSLSSADLQD